MASRSVACALSAATATVFAGCSSPFYESQDNPLVLDRTLPRGVTSAAESVFRQRREPSGGNEWTLSGASSPDDYIRYALYHSPAVESAYQQWRAASERLPQVGGLPDPRLTFGYFVEEVQTRTGPQNARIGVQQTLPWPGRLDDREDAASKAAAAAWRRFEAARLGVAERVVAALHELAYLDRTILATQGTLELTQTFEEVLRARYRVGAGSHPELIRAQVELGELEDRVLQLKAMRPSLVAELNAVLDRPASVAVPAMDQLPGRVALTDAEGLVEIAKRTNPILLGLDEQVAEQQFMAAAARKDGLPDLTVGVDYIFTGRALTPGTPGSGDDPIMLSVGINLPIWRDKYDAAVRESLARRLSIASERADQSNRIEAAIHRAWFEHTDADRRVRLYEQTLIPKAEESLRASLAGFRGGETSFLDLLDTERTLLEFAVAAERARADRGKALARLNTLVGEPVATNTQTPNSESPEVQP